MRSMHSNKRVSITEWIKLFESFRQKGQVAIHTSALIKFYPNKKSLSVILNRLEKKGIITRLTKNWICINPCDIVKAIPVVFPSAYLSLEWALHFHDIIDQEVKVYTIVWLQKTKKIHRKAITFELHKISRKLYFGFDSSNIALPEKALLDTVYFRGYIPYEINEDLLNFNRLREYLTSFPRSVKRIIKARLL